MSERDINIKPGEIVALPVTLANLIEAIGQSPIRGPFPRFGRNLGNNEIRIPHFFTRPTIEHPDHRLDIGYDEPVILYTSGSSKPGA